MNEELNFCSFASLKMIRSSQKVVIALCFILPVLFWIYMLLNSIDVFSTVKISYLERVDLFTEAPLTGVRNIFFIESTCAITSQLRPSPQLSESGVYLSIRAACAIEATARFNPQRPVYLVHTCPIQRDKIWTATKDYALQVFSLPNVHLWPVSVKDVFQDSPAKDMYRILSSESQWPVQHASDIMRLVLLWKYGGTYLDTDVFLMRSLENKKNFVCSKTPEVLNNAAIDFAFDLVGQTIVTACLIDLRNTFNPKVYNFNGPKLISRVILNYCNIPKFNTQQDENCHGLNVLTPDRFHPIHLDLWYRFFEEEYAEDTMTHINKSIGAHVWNHKSQRRDVNLKSKQPFAQMVRRICPNTISVAPFII